MLFKHRVKSPLEKGLNQGKRFFFLYGEGIKDGFLEGMYEGIYSLSETLRNYFLRKKDCRYFAVVHTEGVHVYTIDDEQMNDVSEDFLMPEEVEDDMPDDEEEGGAEEEQERTMTAEPQNIQDEIQRRGINIVNHINRIKNKADANTDPKNKIAVFFEDFEWMAKLYSTNNDASLEYIKILKDFMKIRHCYTVVSLENMELLKQYNFAMKGSNVISIGNPSAKEVKYAFLRDFLKNTDFKDSPRDNNNYEIEIQENLLNELEEVSCAVASSQKSLREALHVFETLVIEQKKQVIDRTDFEIAVEKITAEKVTLDEVIIDENEKRKIINAVDAFIESDDTLGYRKGFILTGPPGTGKTQIVKAIANEKNCYFMAPTLSELKGEYIGHSSTKIKMIFDEARANEPTILFIDEADTVFPMRDTGTTDGFNLDMVNQFLQEVDGMKSGKEKVFVIAATNRPNIIDTAVQSRLSERILIDLPSASNRIRIFDSKLKKYHFSLGDKSYRSEIESKTINMSGRDIDNFVKKLKEDIADTSFREIANLKDNEKSKNVFLKILEDNEKALIEDFKRSVPVIIEEPDHINVRYSDIIGYSNVKERISRQAEFIRCPESKKLQFKKFGIKMNKGILLYGPSGNAKTKLAKAAAVENNFYFIKVISKDFVDDSVSKQLDNLRMIFDQTLRLSKMCSKYDGVLLFFDEFDSLAGYRCLNQVIRGTLLDYLASGETDDKTGIRSPQSRILLMAATNFYKQLDEAVIRKGRIDEHLLLDNPIQEDGINMIKYLAEHDEMVELEEEGLAKNIYDFLSEKVVQTYEADLEPDIDRKRVREMIRPSGSDIVNLFHDIKTQAFFEQRELVKDGGRLMINQDLLDNYLKI